MDRLGQNRGYSSPFRCNKPQDQKFVMYSLDVPDFPSWLNATPSLERKTKLRVGKEVKKIQSIHEEPEITVSEDDMKLYESHVHRFDHLDFKPVECPDQSLFEGYVSCEVTSRRDVYEEYFQFFH